MLHGVVGVGSIVVAFAAGSSSDAARASDGKADGKALYLEHCAACHGKEGGGDGPTAKDLRFKPRAFKEGRFAFGNTADVMAKTVASGIPGEDQPRMPSFTSVLDKDEIESVVEYVRSLMPKQQELGTDDMTMVVTESAKLARGLLAPLRAGEKTIPRGLVVGLPGGLSFEYATDDLRLLAVRRFDAKTGEFLSRSDWQGRGGRPLTPLGDATWIAPTLEKWAPFLVADPPKSGEKPAFAPAKCVLRSTRVRGPVAELEFDLVDPKGICRAHATTRLGSGMAALARSTSGVALDTTTWTENFELSSSNGPVVVLCSLAIARDPKATDDPALRQQRLDKSRCAVVASPGGGTAVVALHGSNEATLSTFEGEDFECVDTQLLVDVKPVVVRRHSQVSKSKLDVDSILRDLQSESK